MSRRFSSPSVSISILPNATAKAVNQDRSKSLQLSSGAFQSHSIKNLSSAGNGKRREMSTQAAVELAHSRRSIIDIGADTIRSTNNEAAADDASDNRSRRKSLVNYGVKSVKRIDEDDYDMSDTIPSIDLALLLHENDVNISSAIGIGVRRLSGSISAREGDWLVKSNSAARRKSGIGVSWGVYDKKNSDHPTPEDTISRPETASPEMKAKINQSKSVNFSSVTIRYHPFILGNNPFCSSGPPLELAWKCESSSTDSNVPINVFEEVRGPYRRSEWDLALSRGERESLLLEAGFSRDQIAAAIRECSHVKAHRANTVVNMKMSGVEEVADEIRRKGTKMVGLRWSSNWLYHDWKGDRSSRRYQSYLASPPVQSSDTTKSARPSFDETKKKKKKVSTKISPKEAEVEHRDISHDGPAFGIACRSFSTKVVLSSGEEKSEPDGDKGMPFAEVKVVYAGSPAHEAGLKRGDRLIKLGSITRLNHNHCKAIPEIGQVAATKEQTLLVVIENPHGERRTVTIQPKKWNGRGHFGFLFRELKEVQ